MDTSKEYIEMCQKATEIQVLWEPNAGDYFHWHYSYNKEMKPNIYNWSTRHYNGSINKRRSNQIWLPRQDQLQDMIQIDKHKSTLIVHLVNWMQDNIKCFKDAEPEKQYPTESLEQLWLVFVMDEKYNKKWDGKGWENNEKRNP